MTLGFIGLNWCLAKSAEKYFSLPLKIHWRFGIMISDMQKVNTRWSFKSFKAASAASKTVRGCVAVIVTDALGEDSFLYSTVVPVFKKSEQEAVESLKTTLPKNVGIYAVVKSSDPEAVIEKTLVGIIDADDPDCREDVGKIRFYNLPPDGLISFLRNAAFALLAEQHPFTIVDEWGTL